MSKQYGCPACGTTEFRGDGGYTVISAGERNGVAYGKKVESEQSALNPNRHADVRFRSSTWVCGHGHPVEPGSSLEQYLNSMSTTEAMPMQWNE